MPGRCAGKAQLSTFYEDLEMADVNRAIFADVARRALVAGLAIREFKPMGKHWRLVQGRTLNR